MKKTVYIMCFAAALMAFGGCADKTKTPENSISVQETIPTVTEPEWQPETVPPRKKIADSDYFGKWIPKKIIVDEDVYEDCYMDIDFKYLFQLEINEDGTAVMGHAIPDNEKKTYNWMFISGMIEMNGESDCSVYGSMPYEDLILTDGEGIKIYMEHTDTFDEMSEGMYEAVQDYNGDIVIPELNIEKADVSPAEYVGKWECDFYELDGIVYRDKLYDIPLSAVFCMDITSDGKAKFIVGGNDKEAIITDYTWELYANGCAGLYEDGECVGIIHIKNNKLYLDQGNDISHFKKVDEFTDFDWSSVNDDIVLD